MDILPPIAVATLALFAGLVWVLFRATPPKSPPVNDGFIIRRIETGTRKLVDNVLSGEYHTIFKGAGIEFDESRLYQPGDDVRAMDWNVTARTGEPHVKRFREEREQTLILLVDLSASGSFGSGARFKVETAARLAAALAFSAIKNNDKVGLIAFTDRIELFVPPKKGKRHVMRLIRDILSFVPAGKGTDIGAALLFLNRVVKKRAIVFALSDFIDEGFDAPMKVVAKRHDVVAIRIVDPREETVAAGGGLVALEDAEKGIGAVVNLSSPATGVAVSRAADLRRTVLTKTFAAAGVDQVVVEADGDFVGPIIRFFKAREKRRRFG